MKKEQHSAIKTIHERKEVLACLSTGYHGKSLCYQTLPLSWTTSSASLEVIVSCVCW